MPRGKSLERQWQEGVGFSIVNAARDTINGIDPDIKVAERLRREQLALEYLHIILEEKGAGKYLTQTPDPVRRGKIRTGVIEFVGINGNQALVQHPGDQEVSRMPAIGLASILRQKLVPRR